MGKARLKLPVYALSAAVILICLAVSTGPAWTKDQVEGAAVLGTWLTGAEGKEPAKVTITSVGGEYIGRIVWLQYPRFRPGDEPGMEGKPKIDLQNPDPELRDRPVLGMTILEGFRFDPGKRWPWTGGTVYDPERGKTYSARMRLEDENTLRIKGFVLIPLFGRSTTWTRVSLPEAG
jgi:hypothetical protein